MKRTTAIRVALGYMAISTFVVGVWAQFAPRSFYDSFPGLGSVWIAVDGPYNEHLVRDVGGLNLAITVMLAAAAFKLERSLVIVASVAAMAYGLPHVVYHAVNTDGLSTGDVVGILTGLALFAAIPILVISLMVRRTDSSAV